MSEEKKGRSRKNTEEEPQETSLGKEILSWLQIIVAAVVIAFVLNNFVIANSRIPTGSMENTIMSHSRVIGSRLSYIKDDPERGDIVIFRYPDNEKVYYVKRVIGLPGEWSLKASLARSISSIFIPLEFLPAVDIYMNLIIINSICTTSIQRKDGPLCHHRSGKVF